MTVDGFRVELSLRVDEAERHAAARGGTERDHPIEAGSAPGVAGGLDARRLDLQPDRILVAVGAHLDDALRVPALLALAPEAAARPRPIMRLARLDGAGKRLFIHVGEHQYLAGPGGGGDHG